MRRRSADIRYNKDSGTPWTTIHPVGFDPGVREQSHQRDCWPVRSVLGQTRWPLLIQIGYNSVFKKCTRILDPIVEEGSPWTTTQSADITYRIKKPSPCYELALQDKACLTSPDDQHLFKTATAMWQKNCTSMLGPITENGTAWTIIYLDDLYPIVRNQSHRYESWPAQSVSDQWSWPSLIQIFQCINHSVHWYYEP